MGQLLHLPFVAPGTVLFSFPLALFSQTPIFCAIFFLSLEEGRREKRGDFNGRCLTGARKQNKDILIFFSCFVCVRVCCRRKCNYVRGKLMITFDSYPAPKKEGKQTQPPFSLLRDVTREVAMEKKEKRDSGISVPVYQGEEEDQRVVGRCVELKDLRWVSYNLRHVGTA